ncbi:MAG TPA: methyltransferase domain-containing protein, partial [Gammaproteobacteria bacterium]
QHLGFHSPLRRLNRATLDALANLARRARTGDILVARTSRLLDFIVARACLQFEAVDRGDRVIVDVAGVDCPLRGMLPPTPDNLRGITFETDAGRPLELQLRGRPVPGTQLFEEVRDGARRCGIRWFDPDLEDHSAPYREAARSMSADGGSPAAGGFAELNRAALASLDDPGQLSAIRGPDLDKAIRYTRGRLRLGIDHYARTVEALGFTGLRSVLDVGAGPGHWCLSLAAIDGNVNLTGVELRAEYVDIASALARRLGFEPRARFLRSAAEDMSLAKGSFDGAWCHSALMFTDHERVLWLVSDSLAGLAPFYCGYSTVGHHVNAAFSQFRRGNAARVPALLENILAGALYDCGISRTPAARRVISQFDLIQLARVCGFVYRAEPDLEDGVREFLGYPQTFDVLFGKRYAADEEEQRLLGHARIGSPEWAAELEALVALGCPHLVLRVLDRSGVEKESAAIRPTFLRALLKAGQRERLKAAAPRAWFSRLEPALHGRVHHALGDDRAAERAYDKAARRDDPDIRFLKAMLRVGRRSWRDAAREFDAMLEADPDSLRARAGRALCVAQSGTGEDLRAELRRWVESRRPSTTGDEADAWMRHIDSAGTAPPDQDSEPD